IHSFTPSVVSRNRFVTRFSLILSNCFVSHSSTLLGISRRFLLPFRLAGLDCHRIRCPIITVGTFSLPGSLVRKFLTSREFTSGDDKHCVTIYPVTRADSKPLNMPITQKCLEGFWLRPATHHAKCFHSS